jgi:hypothetical protein
MRRRRHFPHIAQMKVDPAVFPTADQIAARAHTLFVSGGRRLTDLPEHWQRAEEELLDEAARRTLARLADPVR